MSFQQQHKVFGFSLNPWLPASIAMAGDGKHLAVVMAKGYTQPLYGLAEEGAQIRYYSINSYTRTPELVKTENIEGELLVNSAEWDADHVTLCYATMDVFDAYKLHRSNAFGQSRFTYTDVLPKPASLARGANHRLFVNALGLNNLYELGNEQLLATDIGIAGTVVNGTMPYQHQLIFDKEKEEQNLYARELGNKLYEITDHLGNVRATITDKLSLNNNVYEADLTSASTYYPFGMSIGTLSDISDYRFGFNGKEKDDEFKGSGNSYDFGARIYDNRLGRWWSTDALSRKFPGWSPYNYSINNPITFTDPDGNDVTITVKAKKVGTTKINLYSSTEINKDATKKGKTKTVPVYEVSVANESGSTATFYFTRDSYRGQSDGTEKEVTFNVRNDDDEFLGKIKSRWKGTDNVLELRDIDDIKDQGIEAMKADVDAIRTAIQFHLKGASDGCLLCVGKDQFESKEEGVTITETNLKSNSKDTQAKFMSKIKAFRDEDKKAKKGDDIKVVFKKVTKSSSNTSEKDTKK